jgi:hypothetical protein
MDRIEAEPSLRLESFRRRDVSDGRRKFADRRSHNVVFWEQAAHGIGASDS